MRHYNLALALVLFSALALCQVRAVDIPTIPDFHVVVGLPEEMIAGSTYQTSFTFVKPNHKQAELNIIIEITEDQSIIGFEEFHVEGKLDMWTAHPRGHETVKMDFTETSGGVFQFQRLIEEVSFNCVTASITSAPNLMPGTYTFTLTVTLQYD
jgi:hypothetical protein